MRAILPLTVQILVLMILMPKNSWYDSVAGFAHEKLVKGWLSWSISGILLKGITILWKLGGRYPRAVPIRLTHRLSLYQLDQSNVSISCLRWSKSAVKCPYPISNVVWLWIYYQSQHRPTRKRLLLCDEWKPNHRPLSSSTKKNSCTSLTSVSWKSNHQGLCFWETPIHLAKKERK